MTNKEYMSGVIILINTFDMQFTPSKHKTWYELLKDLPLKAFQTAILTLAKTSKFPPKVADIREIATKYMLPASLSAEEAWENIVMPAIRNGELNSIKDWKTLRACKLLGLSTLRDQTESSRTWNRKEFIRLYDTLTEGDKLALQSGSGEVKDPRVRKLLAGFTGERKALKEA